MSRLGWSRGKLYFPVLFVAGSLAVLLLVLRPWSPEDLPDGWQPADEAMRNLLVESAPDKVLAAQPKPSTSVKMPETAKPKVPPAPERNAVKVDLNKADSQELEQLPGIGASRAQAILELRQRLGGRFTHVEQLLEVKGIGDNMLEKLKPHVTIEP